MWTHAGMPEYGTQISTEKRLTNFDVALRPAELTMPWADEGEYAVRLQPRRPR